MGPGGDRQAGHGQHTHSSLVTVIRCPHTSHPTRDPHFSAQSHTGQKTPCSWDLLVTVTRGVIEASRRLFQLSHTHPWPLGRHPPPVLSSAKKLLGPCGLHDTTQRLWSGIQGSWPLAPAVLPHSSSRVAGSHHAQDPEIAPWAPTPPRSPRSALPFPASFAFILPSSRNAPFHCPSLISPSSERVLDLPQGPVTSQWAGPSLHKL